MPYRQVVPICRPQTPTDATIMATALKYRRILRNGSLFCVLFPLCIPGFSTAAPIGQPEEETLQYLKSLSIEELLQTRITSVSKKSEQLFNVAAAVTVITQEDLERTGARTIPEALRLVPGLQVAQLDGSRYAVSSRGFNEYFANKLLVLIDGRSVYTPLFSGVYWNAQDTIIEDIERIEVIRGPGATVWGANAVNGVINIITKNSADTQGGLVSTMVGSHVQPMVSSRYGGRIDDDTSYRLYAKGFQQEEFDAESGGDAHDAWESLRAGFRADRRQTGKDTLSLQAELYDNEADGSFQMPVYSLSGFITAAEGTEHYDGGHVLATWNHRFTTQSNLDFQLYYDHSRRDQVVAEETRDTADFEFKHHWDPSGAHDIVWGSNFRWTKDDINGTTHISFNPDSTNDRLLSAFVQDDISLVPDTAWITLGSKFEHNEYSGFEIQPSVRLRYKPSDRQIIWAAVSRAVRTPSRSDNDVIADLGKVDLGGGAIANARLLGNDNFEAEDLIAYELGYRWQPSDSLSVDLAGYYNDYHNLRTLDPGRPFPDTSVFPPLVLPIHLANSLQGNTYGFELQGTWQATNRLKISTAYTLINFDLHFTNSQLTGTTVSEEELSPKQQFQLRSYLDLTHNLTLDGEVYFVDELEERNIDSYLRLDLQLSWQAGKHLKLSVAAENMFTSSHQEFPVREDIVPSEIPQQYWLKASYAF